MLSGNRDYDRLPFGGMRMSTQSPVKSPVEALRWRYATKKFDPSKKITADVWAEIQEAVRLSASSFGLQPWKFVVVSDQATKERIKPAVMNQAQTSECSHFVVVCRLDKIDNAHVEDYLQDMAQTRGVTSESLESLRKMLNGFVGGLEADRAADWMARQCYIALGTLLLSASQHGVDNCPMEGFDRDALDKALDLPSKGCRSVVCCALGYRHPDDKYGKLAKVRFDPSRVFINI
jgi:nitroreductase